MVEEQQHLHLESKYPFVFMDVLHYKVKHNNHKVSNAAYVIVEINMDGKKERKKDVLGIWIGGRGK